MFKKHQQTKKKVQLLDFQYDFLIRLAETYPECSYIHGDQNTMDVFLYFYFIYFFFIFLFPGQTEIKQKTPAFAEVFKNGDCTFYATE